jgi:hypothetical protein
MASYNNDDLITAVLNRAQLPSSSSANNINSNANLLKLGTEEIYTKILPMILGIREEWYVASYNHTITAETANYAFPPRASGRILRDVQLINGSDVSSLSPVNPEEISTTDSGTPSGFYIEDDNLVLYPTPISTTGTLRLRYFRRPNRLAETSDCGQITAINTNTSTITVTATPSSWGAATLIDIRVAKPLVRGSARVRDVNALLDVVDNLVPRIMESVASR